MTSSPYVQIYGLECGDVIRADGGVSPDGGEREADQFAFPGQDTGKAIDKGRKPRTWRFKARFLSKEDMTEWIAECRNAPEDCETFPFEAGRSFYVAKADAKVSDAEPASPNGVPGWLYRAEAKIISRESHLYGPDQGLLYRQNVALPLVSALLTNEGFMEAGLDYFLASGEYDSGYTDDLTIRLTPGTSSAEHDREILLCSMLMRGDLFALDRWGNCEHSYETEFPQTYAALQTDLHGSNYVNYGSGGSISLGSLVIGNSGKLLMPFYGPLPCGETPVLELDISALTGTPDVQVAFETNLSDLATVDHNPLIVGSNAIQIPDCQGEDFMAFGVVTGGAEALTLSRIKGLVPRYISKAYIDALQFDPAETFKLRIEDGAASNHKLQAAMATYRDIFPC